MSKKLQVIVANAAGENKTINLPNPKSSLTLSSVQSAFAPFFTNGYLINGSGTQTFTAIKSAKIIETTESNLN